MNLCTPAIFNCMSAKQDVWPWFTTQGLWELDAKFMDNLHMCWKIWANKLDNQVIQRKTRALFTSTHFECSAPQTKDTCGPSALKTQWQIKTGPHYSCTVCTLYGFTERTPVGLDFKENNTKSLLAVSCHHLHSGVICSHDDSYSFNLVKVQE